MHGFMVADGVTSNGNRVLSKHTNKIMRFNGGILGVSGLAVASDIIEELVSQ